MLEIIKTDFPDVYVIKLNPFVDDRGSYARLFCEKELASILNDKHIVNINYQVTNKRGTIRGLHYQEGKNCEAKIIKCVKGRILDVIVDMRPCSKTYLGVFTKILDEDSKELLYVGEGYAHGFQTLEDNTETMYFTTQFYDPQSERGINPLDPVLTIEWPIKAIILSDKDRNRPFMFTQG